VPVRRLLEAGAQVALGADDPLLFGSRLAAQYETARAGLGLADEELAALARGSVHGSRAPEALRKTLLEDIEDWLKAPAGA
jgi:adenosine deaminase